MLNSRDGQAVKTVETLGEDAQTISLVFSLIIHMIPFLRKW